MFKVVIENNNEEFEIIGETPRLDEAIEIAKQEPKENYKSIRIDLVDENERIIKVIELELK